MIASDAVENYMFLRFTIGASGCIMIWDCIFLTGAMLHVEVRILFRALEKLLPLKMERATH